MTYYDLWDDMTTSTRWYLSAPRGQQGEWLGRQLHVGQPFAGSGPLQIPVFREGPPLELTVASDMVPVVNGRVGEIFERHARDDLQLIPAIVAGASDPLWV